MHIAAGRGEALERGGEEEVMGEIRYKDMAAENADVEIEDDDPGRTPRKK